MTDDVPDDLNHELRAWASGDLGLEAAVDLLTRAALLKRYARSGSPLLGHAVWIDFDDARGDLLARRLGPDEQAVVGVALALSGCASTVVVDLSTLGGVIARASRRTLALVLAAISHAAGTHLDTEPTVVRSLSGRPVAVPHPRTLGPLYPWPDGDR